jgi:thiol-disulfide isomerase/thioredoxin
VLQRKIQEQHSATKDRSISGKLTAVSNLGGGFLLRLDGSFLRLTSVLMPLFCLLLVLLTAGNLQAQNIQPVKAAELLERVEAAPDTTFILNFWATWCAPCVKEMPYFEALNKAVEGEPIKVIFISLDFKKDYQTRLPAFIEKRGIQSEVLFLDERDANTWVPLFSESWSGVIPATYVVCLNNKVQDFRASAFEEGELEQWLKEIGAMP